MAVQTTEQKKEEFRKDLEKAGVIDQLTKVLVGLYEEPEKPGNVIEFIKSAKKLDIDLEKLFAVAKLGSGNSTPDLTKTVSPSGSSLSNPSPILPVYPER